ncbi:octapeptide-repeat protein T2-like [Haliaeetus albicilla]|uniref:octapeptide-repeat protein T2-like n=1 Tax=Haliaeetus albicilla TaxID=8969 RepID=UPI0037E95532
MDDPAGMGSSCSIPLWSSSSGPAKTLSHGQERQAKKKIRQKKERKGANATFPTRHRHVRSRHIRGLAAGLEETRCRREEGPHVPRAAAVREGSTRAGPQLWGWSEEQRGHGGKRCWEVALWGLGGREGEKRKGGGERMRRRGEERRGEERRGEEKRREEKRREEKRREEKRKKKRREKKRKEEKRREEKRREEKRKEKKRKEKKRKEKKRKEKKRKEKKRKEEKKKF